MRFQGFIFTVKENGSCREVRLWGNGGLMGDGLLWDKKITKTVISNSCHYLLDRVRDELADDGYLKEFVDDEDPKNRVKVFIPDEIVSVRVILTTGNPSFQWRRYHG